MVPWPIALLTVWYAVIATISAANVWHCITGFSERPVAVPLLWLAGSVAAVCGLPLLKPWGRLAALAGAWALGLMSLSVAAALILQRHPWMGLLATLGAGVQLVVIRYLRRPNVRRWFTQGMDAVTS